MKTECIEIIGTITKVLPNSFFNVILKEHETVKVLAYLSGKMTKMKISLGIGDTVLLEMSPTDYTKGRIVKRIT